MVEKYDSRRLATSIVSSPRATASAPPGQKSYCRSTRISARMARILDRQLEALLEQPLVLAAVEAVQPRGAMSYTLLHLVGLDEEIHREDLLAEVSLVEVGAEDDLVQPLQLCEREPRRQELEADRGVAPLAAQPLVRAADDLVVVERELGQVVEREPADAHRVGRGADPVIGELGERVVRHRDHALARIAAKPAERVELLEVDVLDG